MRKGNKIDAVVDEVLESKRVQQGGGFIKKLFFMGLGLYIFVLAVVGVLWLMGLEI